MYIINTKTDKPDLVYLHNRIKNLVEEHGIRLNDLTELFERYTAETERVKSVLKEKYGIQNPNSPKQVIGYLKALSNNIPITDKNEIIEICVDENGKWSANADALAALEALGFEFAKDMIEYRYNSGRLKYLKIFQDICKDGRVYPKVGSSVTNRVQYSEPPLLSIPKEILWEVVAPDTEDEVLYSMDVKNQEPTILINWLNIEELKPALNSPDGLYEFMLGKVFHPRAIMTVEKGSQDKIWTEDEIYTSGLSISPTYYTPSQPGCSSIYVEDKKLLLINNMYQTCTSFDNVELPEKVKVMVGGKKILNVEVDWVLKSNTAKKREYYGYLKEYTTKIPKAERKEFKTAWLAVTYGMGIKSAIERAKLIDGGRVYRFIRGLDGYKAFQKGASNWMDVRGVVPTLFGTLIPVEDKGTQLLNLPIQGSGADILAFLIKHIDEEIEQRGLTGKIKIYYTRHDEIIFSVNKDYEKEIGSDGVMKQIYEIAEHRINDWEPFKMEVKRVSRKAA